MILFKTKKINATKLRFFVLQFLDVDILIIIL